MVFHIHNFSFEFLCCPRDTLPRDFHFKQSKKKQPSATTDKECARCIFLRFSRDGRTQPYFEPRNVPKRPIAAATPPPMSIQTALSVGEPVKNRNTSELKEFVALTPATMS